MAIDIFLSVGRTANKDQEMFVEAIERLLQDNNFAPRRAQWSSVQPLKKIEEVLSSCKGSVVIAFERVQADVAVELRGGADEVRHTNLKVPTVWNHIEAALVYSRGLPMLILCEKDVRKDGLLEGNYDWNVHGLSIHPDAVQTRAFQGIFADWRERVNAFASQAKVSSSNSGSSGPTNRPDYEKITFGELINSLKVTHLYAVATAVVSLLIAVAGIAYKIGGIQDSSGQTPRSNKASSDLIRVVSEAQTALQQATASISQARDFAAAAQSNTSDARTCSLRASQSLEKLAPAFTSIDSAKNGLTNVKGGL